MDVIFAYEKLRPLVKSQSPAVKNTVMEVLASVYARGYGKGGEVMLASMRAFCGAQKEKEGEAL